MMAHKDITGPVLTRNKASTAMMPMHFIVAIPYGYQGAIAITAVQYVRSRTNKPDYGLTTESRFITRAARLPYVLQEGKE